MKRKIFTVIFVLLLLGSVGLRIYKAHYTGITYDESFTYSNFCGSVGRALTYYRNPNNNHVINSIFICLVGKLFGSYEHFIRIHSVIFSAVFSFSVAYIVCKTIRSDVLKILLTSLVLLNWFVFDLSFLARGYSIALAGCYAGLAGIVWLLTERIKYRYRFVPVMVIVLMNFFAMGSMLSSLFVMVSINAVFILLYSHRVFSDSPNRLRPAVLNIVGIGLLTIGSLLLLYKELIGFIVKGENTGDNSFALLMKQLLVDSMAGQGGKFTFFVYCVFVSCLVLSSVFIIYRLCKKNTDLGITFESPAVFFVMVTLATILVMFVHRVVLKMPLGFMRNGVFLVPLLQISAVALLDICWGKLKNKAILTVMIRGCVIVVLVLLMLVNLPSSHAVEVYNWAQQSLSAPLLRRLKEIDPHRTWKIGLIQETQYCNLPLLYYRQFDHKFQVVYSGDWDVLILPETLKPEKTVFLDVQRFKKFNCFVCFNPRKTGVFADSTDSIKY
ncbi:hypothetical protein ACFL3G_10525 [Planctomycetota bacterium]